jgi:hypothetical protein
MGTARHRESRGPAASTAICALTVRLAGSLFPRVGFPKGGWSGDTNPWDASELILNLISQISTDPSDDAGRTLAELERDKHMKSYRDDVKHAIAQQYARAIDSRFRPPTWKQALETLRNGRPSSVADLQALAMAHLHDLGSYIAATNVDAYKRFWNENASDQVITPKSENSSRNYLVELLRSLFRPQEVQVEPEVHMAFNKRSDIALSCPGMKLVVELKRDYHKDVWTAAENQLDRFYTKDPDAQGLGIYGVFWYGRRRPRAIPRPPNGMPLPKSGAEMVASINLSLRATRERVQAFVLDVSGPTDKIDSKAAQKRKVQGVRRKSSTSIPVRRRRS